MKVFSAKCTDFWLVVEKYHLPYLSIIHPLHHNDANGIKHGSNMKRTVKQAAENSKTVCLGIN